MKNIFPIIIACAALLSSCDSPRSQRSLTSSSNSGLATPNAVPVNLNNSSTTTTGTGTTTTPANGTSTTGTGTSAIPTDVNNCKFSSDGINGFDATSAHLGDYSLCKSTSDANLFYFQLKTPPTNNNGDVSVCLIPTSNVSSGSNSIYVGNPMCGYFKNPTSITKINFVKFSQYANATINGVIMFKDLSWSYPVYYQYTYGYGYYPVYNNYINTLDAYKLCMNMIADINNSTNCTYFKNAGQYVYKQF